MSFRRAASLPLLVKRVEKVLQLLCRFGRRHCSSQHRSRRKGNVVLAYVLDLLERPVEETGDDGRRSIPSVFSGDQCAEDARNAACEQDHRQQDVFHSIFSSVIVALRRGGTVASKAWLYVLF